MVLIILLIISIIVSSIIINKVQQLFMQFLNIDFMFVNAKRKLFAILVLGFVITAVVAKLLGLT